LVGGAVERASHIDQISRGKGAIAAALEGVEHTLDPVRRHLEHRAAARARLTGVVRAARAAALVGGAVERAAPAEEPVRHIGDQTGLGNGAIAAAPGRNTPRPRSRRRQAGRTSPPSAGVRHDRERRRLRRHRRLGRDIRPYSKYRAHWCKLYGPGRDSTGHVVTLWCGGQHAAAPISRHSFDHGDSKALPDHVCSAGGGFCARFRMPAIDSTRSKPTAEPARPARTESRTSSPCRTGALGSSTGRSRAHSGATLFPNNVATNPCVTIVMASRRRQLPLLSLPDFAYVGGVAASSTPAIELSVFATVPHAVPSQPRRGAAAGRVDVVPDDLPPPVQRASP
jgi:hypothetical protein